MPLLSRRRVGDNKCVGLRTGAGVGEEPGMQFARCPVHCTTMRCRHVYSRMKRYHGESSGLKTGALWRFDGDVFSGIGLKPGIFTPIGGKSMQAGGMAR